MIKPESNSMPEIPAGLKPYFHEYDAERLSFEQDANLIIQRTLEFGTWEEVRWLIGVYGARRIRLFLRQHGVRWLSPVVFGYWRKLMGIRKWQVSTLPTPKGELWKQ